MDAPRFDDLARATVTMATRRRTLGLATAAMLAAFGLNDAVAKKNKKCKPCGPCAKCKKGKCKPKKPAGTPCGEGKQCFANGKCTACDVCSAGCPHTTLQQAIAAAPNGATIQICPGTYPTNAVIERASEPDREFTVIGAGSGRGGTILDGQERDHVLLASGTVLELRRLAITRGRANSDAGGGGIAVSQSDLTLSDVHVTGNDAGGEGGGIWAFESTTMLIKSSVTENSSAIEGGGIHNLRSTLTLTVGSRVSGNTAPAGRAGGISNVQSGTVEVSKNSRVTGNSPLNCTGTDAC